MPPPVNSLLVKPSPDASGNDFTCGEPAGLAAGDWVYFDQNDLDTNGIGKARFATASSLGPSDVGGCCANAAHEGQPVTVVGSDPKFNPGFLCDPGVRYVLHVLYGRITPITDAGPGWFLSDVGYGNADRTLNMEASPKFIAQTTTTTSTTTTTTTTTP